MCTLQLFSHVNSVSKDSGQVCGANLLLREHSNLSALAPSGTRREHVLKIVVSRIMVESNFLSIVSFNSEKSVLFSKT